MSERARTWAFLVAAFLVAVALVALGSRSRGRDLETPTHEIGAQVGSSGLSTDEPRTASPDSLLEPRRVASRFLEAFLKYQEGNLERARPELLATATRRLALSLLSRPPRPARGRPTHAQIRQLYVQRYPQGRVKASASLSYGNGSDASLLEFVLTRSEQRWRVTDLYR
jgi:hypothetical protein